MVLPACSGRTPDNAGDPSILSADERALFERFAEAYLPTDGTPLKPLQDVPIADNIARTLSLLDEPTLKEVRLGLKLFNLGSVVIGFHLTRFINLDIAQRERYIRRWDDGAETQRAVAGLIKKLVNLGYWQDIEAARAIGYQGPVSEPGQIPTFGNAPMPADSISKAG